MVVSLTFEEELLLLLGLGFEFGFLQVITE